MWFMDSQPDMIGFNPTADSAKVRRSREPGLRGFVMHLGDILRNGDAAFDRMFDRYGDVLWLRVPKFFEIFPGVSEVAFVRDPALIKPLFTAPDEVIDSATPNRVLGILHGDRSLLLMEGSEHRRLRRLLLSRLRGEALQQWADVIVRSAEREARSWLAEESVRVHHRMLNVSLEAILAITLGISDETLPTWKAAWHELGETWGSEEMAIRYALRRLGGVRRWRRFRRALARCNELVFAEIARRRATPNCGTADLLDLMLRADGVPLSDNEIRDQIFTIMLAGQETTAITVGWAIERLLRSPSAMKKATAEARSTDATTYMEAVVHETLRLRPPITGLGRVTRQPITLGGYDFPANVLIAPLIRSIHRKPELYDDPDRFMPERFLDTPPGVYSLIPFGGGSHRCLGDRLAVFESTLILKTILRTVELSAVDPRDEKVKRKAAVFVPGNGALVRAQAIPHASQLEDA
ncbi:cytochrome P450 [Mycobacterium gastri]|nr:cytochrome P450 [Mycobacterium gastri]